MWTTFGAVPIGARFSVLCRERDTRDRRRRVDVERTYTKTRHGTIAGFAIGNGGEPRFNHCTSVKVVDDDLRLIVAVVRNEQTRQLNG